jgi:soluble lytic murein transglycosylase
MALAISRWELLTSSNRFGFSDYAGFLLSYPGFPEEELAPLPRPRSTATRARRWRDVRATVAYFDRLPPLTNPGARAMPWPCALGRPDADAMAKAAARRADERCRRGDDPGHLGRHVHARRRRCADGRACSGPGRPPRPTAHSPRSPLRRGIDGARLMALQGFDPSAAAAVQPAAAQCAIRAFSMPARELRKQGQGIAAQALLANRPLLRDRPLLRGKWIDELLANAQGAARWAMRAAPCDRAQRRRCLAPGEDISQMPYDLRDDYTSLVWLGGTQALWKLGDAAGAAPLFCAMAMPRRRREPGQGLYWAGAAPGPGRPWR